MNAFSNLLVFSKKKRQCRHVPLECLAGQFNKSLLTHTYIQMIIILLNKKSDGSTNINRYGDVNVPILQPQLKALLTLCETLLCGYCIYVENVILTFLLSFFLVLVPQSLHFIVFSTEFLCTCETCIWLKAFMSWFVMHKLSLYRANPIYIKLLWCSGCCKVDIKLSG